MRNAKHFQSCSSWRKRGRNCWQKAKNELQAQERLRLIMTDDAWRTKQKNMNQREFCFVLFSGNFYRFRSIVERRILFINSLRGFWKIYNLKLVVSIAQNCAESHRTGKESRLSTSISVFVFLFLRVVMFSPFDPEKLHFALCAFLQFLCFHAWRGSAQCSLWVYVKSPDRLSIHINPYS